MATPQQIEQQVKLEREQIKTGIKRLVKNTKDLENKSYGSATIYGISSINELLPKLAYAIDDTDSRIKKGQAGKAFKEINKYLKDIESLATSAIACKLTFDKVFSTKQGSNQVINVTESIGKAIESECQMRHYEKVAPGLLNVLKKKYWHSSIGTQQKHSNVQRVMNQLKVDPWVSWGRHIKIKLGGWILDNIISTSGWFFTTTVREGRRTVNYVVPTKELLDIKDKVMGQSELFAPLAWPMLIEPNDWTREKPGGYLLNEVMRGHEMIRRGNHTRIQGETPFNFLNKIQKVGYRINPFVYDVAEYLFDKGIDIGKFIPIVELPIPPKPVDIETNEVARKRYRRQTAEVMNNNAGAFKRSCRTRMTMEAARQFRNNTFYIPWSFDYRGRTYPIPAFLTPQDTDFGKSLLVFDRPSTVTLEAEEWLAFQVATTYGKDKETWDDRLIWVEQNHTLISAIATDPLGNLSEWENAEEPWQFLAACDEYYHCVIKKDRKLTNLLIAIDATCSGLQILSGLARDASTAKLVNVIPSDEPQDAYKVVAEESRADTPQVIRDVWDRKCVKRTVMTIPYNAKPFSNRSYIRDALKEKKIEIERDELTQTVTAVRNAMKRVVPGPMAVMKWIEDEVSRALSRGVSELEWTTPSDFVVNQRIMKTEKPIRIELQLLGRCMVHVKGDETDKADRARHKAATAPNLIHSLDASLLHLATMRFNHPIALIHDSVLCRATDMSILDLLVRETYADLFSKQNYLVDFAEQIKAETKPPIIGDLEPSDVLNSRYFFC